MGSVNRVYVAPLAPMLVLGPLGENFGRVRDVVISVSIVRQQPRVLGLVVDWATRRDPAGPRPPAAGREEIPVNTKSTIAPLPSRGLCMVIKFTKLRRGFRQLTYRSGSSH
jgi:hypothetical protein